MVFVVGGFLVGGGGATQVGAGCVTPVGAGGGTLVGGWGRGNWRCAGPVKGGRGRPLGDGGRGPLVGGGLPVGVGQGIPVGGRGRGRFWGSYWNRQDNNWNCSQSHKDKNCNIELHFQLADFARKYQSVNVVECRNVWLYIPAPSLSPLNAWYSCNTVTLSKPEL